MIGIACLSARNGYTLRLRMSGKVYMYICRSRRRQSRYLIKGQNADEKRIQLQTFVVNAQSEFFALIGHEGRVSNYIGA